MCNCKPKISIVSRPNHDGYAIETCKICGKQREIPATYFAIMDYLSIHKTHVYHAEDQQAKIGEYALRPHRKIVVERISNRSVLGDY